MFTIKLIYISLLYLISNWTAAQQTIDDEDLLNRCIDSRHHKSEPGPEGALYGQCTPWKDKSCCTSNTTTSMHLDPHSLYGFDHNHCSEVQPLSNECLKHFVQDHCFYECSPNVGPWIVREKRRWRNERYYKIPLCASDCEVWFNACKSDYTCTDNWARNFDWKSKDCDKGKCKRNVCPEGAKCQTFLEIYRTAENFCQRVWDDSWEYTKDENFCMRIWFNGSLGNPNDAVAKWKATQLSQVSAAPYRKSGLLLLPITLTIVLLTSKADHTIFDD